MSNKKNNELSLLIKVLKKMEKHNPTILLIPEKELLNPEIVEEGEIISLKNSYVIAGLQMKRTDNGPILYFAIKGVLETMLEQCKQGVKSDELLMPLDDIVIKKEDVEKLEGFLNEIK